MGYYQKPVNPRTETLIKPSYLSSSNSTKNRLDCYFVLDSNNTKVLNQSEPKTLKSKGLKRPEPKASGHKILKGSEPKVKTHSR